MPILFPKLSLCTARFRTLAGGAAFALLMLPACSKEETSATSAATGSVARPAPVIPANATPAERLILQGRAALGPEDKLNAVTALELSGQVMDDKNQVLGQVTIWFKKPARQRSEMHTATGETVIQGSDGVQGWVLAVDKNDHKRLSVMVAAEEMQNNFMTVENLYFFRGTEHVTGASVTADGDAKFHDATCAKVSFHYPGNFTYVRYFDPASGKLRGTVLEPAGTEFIEEGETTVSGIVFPQVLRSYTKEGQLTQVIKFEKVIVNQPVDDRMFDSPSLISLYAASPAAATAAGTSPSAKPATSSAAPMPASATSAANPPPLQMPALPPLPNTN